LGKFDRHRRGHGISQVLWALGLLPVVEVRSTPRGPWDLTGVLGFRVVARWGTSIREREDDVESTPLIPCCDPFVSVQWHDDGGGWFKAGRRPINKPARGEAKERASPGTRTDSAIQTCQTRHKMYHLIHFMSRLQSGFAWEEVAWCCGIEGVESESGGRLRGDGSPGGRRLHVAGRGGDPPARSSAFPGRVHRRRGRKHRFRRPAGAHHAEREIPVACAPRWLTRINHQLRRETQRRRETPC